MKIENMIVIFSDSENQVSDYEFTVSWAGIIFNNNQDNVEDDEMTSNMKSESLFKYLMSEALESNNDLSLQFQWSSDKSVSERRQILECIFDLLSKRMNLSQSLWFAEQIKYNSISSLLKNFNLFKNVW